MNWFKKLFGWRKPQPKPTLIEFRWSGMATPPDSGSQALCVGIRGKASTASY